MKKTAFFRKIYFSLALLVFTLTPAFFAAAETLYGKVKAVTTVGNGAQPSENLPVRLEDNWGIVLGEEADFLRGVEIQINLPQETQLYTGTYAVFVYKAVTPVPDVNQTSYQGSLIFFKVIEERRRLFIQLPLGSAAGFPGAPDTYIHKTPLSAADFPLIFAVLPIMKGIPEQAMQALFHAEVHPLFKNMGKLLISLPDADSAGDIQVFIDEKAQKSGDGGYLLEPGIRKVRLEKPGYAPFSASIGIDKGKTSVMEAAFSNKASTLRISAPAGTRAFLDGKAVNLREPIPVEAGDHNLSMKIDDYQINRRFTVEPGKTYSVSASLDILINED